MERFDHSRQECHFIEQEMDIQVVLEGQKGGEEAFFLTSGESSEIG